MVVNHPAQNANSRKSSELAEKLGSVHVGTRNDLEVSRHVFFSETSYVVRDPVTFQGHNLSPLDYEVFTSLTDDKMLSEVFDELVEREIVDGADETNFYQYIVELQKQGLLSLPVTDGDSLYRQFEQRRRNASKNPLMKMLFLKIPLGCPDRFLRSTYHLVRAVFTYAFFVIWLVALISACVLVGCHWNEFTSDLASVLAVGNLPAILIVMSLLKLWHEMGHGYACRHYGVSVPSAGLLFMIGTPLAFVDATGSWSLPRRSQRQVINLSGIYFEMMIAIIAAYVWVFTTNDSMKSLAHFTLLVSSVTTIGFNINPLMKYDGYYILADMLGIPNLKSRSSFAVQSLSKRLFFGIKMPNAHSNSLRMILIGYGIASSIYRIMLVVAISIVISMQIWIVGLLIGGYYMVASIGSMFVRLAKYLIRSEEIKHQRALANGYLAFMLVGVPALLLFCPVPGASNARGVAQHGLIDVVHVKDGGFLQEMNVKDGQFVSQGTDLAQIENIGDNAKRLRQKAQLIGLQVKYRRYQGIDTIQSGKAEQEVEQLKYELSMARGETAVTGIKAPANGFIVTNNQGRSTGQYLEPGTELLQIGRNGWVVYAVADANSFADIKPRVGQRVQCRFSAKSDTVFFGTIEEISASGSRVVRHAALTHLAGGQIPVDAESMEATQPFFELMIKLDEHPDSEILRNGIVCEIRFDLSYQSLARLVYRSFIRLSNKVNLK